MSEVTCSFVIPTLNEAAGILQLLADLRARFPDAQLIVVDGGSSDGTADLATPLCDILINSAAGRALQMNRGALEASGQYILFLHADSQPSVDADTLQRYLADTPAWGFCRVRIDGDSAVFRMISFFMNWRSRLTRVATGDQMLFIHRDLLQRAGGFDEIPLMEDVAFSKRLRALASPRLIAEPVTTSSRRWQEAGVLRTILQMWCLRLAYFLGVSPRRLWRYYYGDD
ncbi:MAG: TIGR04283 family arsenosugar biosynthesis glycosyltransferase [Halioglobus sp.]